MALSNGSILNGVTNGNAVIEKNGYTTNFDKDDGEFLKGVLQLVLKHKLVTGMPENEKVVEFLHPAEIKKVFQLAVEKTPCSKAEMLRECEKVVQFSVKTTHPHFYNQLYGGYCESGLAGSWLTEALNTNQYTFEVAPVFMVVEQYVVQFICDLFGWQDGDGIFSPGGSMSNMYGMVLARYRRHPDVKQEGLFGKKPLVAFTSDQSHYSILKGAHWLGLGYNNVVKVATDDKGRMIPEALEDAIKQAIKEGREPFFVNGTAGTTVLGSFDPLDKIQKICQKYELWFHIDACWGGTVALSKTHRHLLKGVELADSVSWNPHKMLGAPLQTSAFAVRHKNLLHHCNSAAATYLFQQDKFYDSSYDTGDKSVQCGRKVDAFKFWILLKSKGTEQLGELVDNSFSASRHLLASLKKRQGFRPVLDEFECTNIGFWYIPPSLRGAEENSEWWEKVAKVAPIIKERMIKKGSMMIGYQPLKPKGYVNFFRMVTTCLPPPTNAHMDFVIDEIEKLGADL